MKIDELSKLSQEDLLKYVDTIQKSNNKPPLLRGYVEVDRKSYTEDPTWHLNEMGWKHKLGLVNDAQKLMIYMRDPTISAIIQTRVSQVCEFANPPQDDFSSGFKFTKKDKSELTPQDEENIAKLTKFIQNCGFTDDIRSENDENLGFEDFLKLIVKDRFIYDTICIEKIPTPEGFLHHFLPVSAASIRLATENFDKTNVLNAEGRKEILPDQKYKYAQVINGNVRWAFTKDELIVKFANPINDFFTNGYSVGEMDLLLMVIVNHLNADKRNRSVFENGFVANGIINLKGEVDEEQLEAFRRAWYTMGSGPNAMYRTPIINAGEGAEFIKTGMGKDDMEYEKLMNYLIKLTCAIYLIDPAEINFSMSSEGGQGSMNYNNLETKIEMSRDKGLRPLLRMISDIINNEILSSIKDEWVKNYQFEFVGLNVESEDTRIDRSSKEIKTYKTVNEVRKEKGLPPLPGCDYLILDGIYMQWYNTFSQEAKEKAEQANNLAAQAQPQTDNTGLGGANNLNLDNPNEVVNTAVPEDPFAKSIVISYSRE